MNAKAKYPSSWRVAVIAAAFGVIVSAMTPAYAVPNRKAVTAKKRLATPASKAGGGAGPASLEWAISSPLRP